MGRQISSGARLRHPFADRGHALAPNGRVPAGFVIRLLFACTCPACYNALPSRSQELLGPQKRISIVVLRPGCAVVGEASAADRPGVPGSAGWKTPKSLPCWSVAALRATRLPGRKSCSATTGASTTSAIASPARRDDAQDLTQEVFIKMYRTLKSYDVRTRRLHDLGHHHHPQPAGGPLPQEQAGPHDRLAGRDAVPSTKTPCR